MPSPKGYTRRDFLQSGLTVVSTAATMPLFLQRSAYAIDNPFAYRQTASQPGVPEDRVLVVIQLAGGNDGLNTIAPFADDAYHAARPGLAIAPDQTLRLKRTEDIGLNPGLESFKDMFDDARVAIVQGVGYPNPNRSHFTSMDIWHTANVKGQGAGTGWLGRYFDNECQGSPESDQCIAIGNQAPLATRGKKTQPIAFENERLFRWAAGDLHPDLAKTYDQVNRAGVVNGAEAESPAGFLMRTALDAQVAGDRIRKAADSEAMVSYPGHALASQLRLVASMIRSEMPTRVYYVSMGGFDTHAGQANRHTQLLRAFAESVKAFYEDLKAQGNSSRVLVMTFSEFGRRVKVNASQGTDHGAAAPMFLIGDMVKPGLHGKQPSLTELDPNGDLVHSVDFRSVYAAVLDRWLVTDTKKVLGESFPIAPVLAV